MMIPFRKSIGFRLLAVSFILLALPLLVDSFILVHQRYRNAIEDAKSYLIEVAQLRGLPISELKPVNQPLIATLTRYLHLKDDFPQKADAGLDEKLRDLANIGQFHAIILSRYEEDDSLVIVAASLPGFEGRKNTDFLKFNSYVFSPENEADQTIVFYFRAGLKPYFMVVDEIYKSKQDKPIGIMTVSREVEGLLDQILAEDEHEYKAQFGLMIPSSIIFAASDPKLAFNYLKPLQPEYRKNLKRWAPQILQQLPQDPIQIGDSVGKPFFTFNFERKKYLGYLYQVPKTSFTLLTYASYETIFRAPLIEFIEAYSIYLAILLIGGMLTLILTKLMVKPVQNLGEVMDTIQKGDLHVRYKKDRFGFEINHLGHVFNQMVDTLLEKRHMAERQRIKRETLASELRLGRQVQMSLLPTKMPAYSGVEMATSYTPAIEVGGDFYDVFVREKGELMVAVADASGKGVGACLFSLTLRNMLRTFAEKYDNVAEAMAHANTLFCTDTGDTGMFVTVVMGMYDHTTHLFQYYSHGHNPLYLRRANGQVEELDHIDMAMGLLPSKKTPQVHSCQLEKDDLIVMYTDGVTEAHNIDKELYGEERLIQLLSTLESLSADEALSAILEDVGRFVGTAPQHDDITLLLLKVTE